MNKRQLIVAWVILFCGFSTVLAYMENYPPHKFKDGPFNHLEAESLVDYGKSEYKSKDGRLLARLEESDFVLQEGKTVLARKQNRECPCPYAVYWADVDKNGLKDFLIFYYYGASSLAGGSVELFLNKDGKSYQKIIYETIRADLGDFVDFNKDGKYEIIITDIYGGSKHNYITYNAYEIKDYKLVNANAKLKGFPKFVWITDKPNDKDTVHLTEEQRSEHAKEKERSIKYEFIYAE